MNQRYISIRIAAMSGFSLLEMSVVLLVMGLLLGSVLKPFGAQMIERQRKATQVQLYDIRDALIGYVAANHRLPCPLVAAQNPAGDCSLTSGFIPAAELGLDGALNGNGLLVDSWGAPIRYSVSSADVDGDGQADFTTVDAIRQLGMQQLQADLEVCDSAPGCTLLRANQVPVVLVSDGANAQPRSDDERENSDGDNRFVSRDVDVVGDDQFDDMVVWLSENVLYTHLIQARVLP